MIQDIYINLLKDREIKKIYDDIGCLEDTKKGWAYHNFNHIMNVTNLVENILSLLKYDKEFISKSKIACLFHDVGALQGKENHAYRSYEFAKRYFENNHIDFEGIEDVLEAIRIHSDGFDSNNVIALSLIFADKLDIKKTRVTKEGKKVIGNRQYVHIEDILINIENNCLVVNFITDNNLDLKEVNEYYFTKKVFKAIESFSNKMNLEYKILMDNKKWIIE
ncbi:MAG: HD domain-containing protein [Bacilli bacterium]|nr:HD domain-containing protein [Bacilli bacterium]